VQHAGYVRFRAVAPNRHGIRPGVFALVNGLASEGRLTEVEERFRREGNAWFTINCTDPAKAVPDLYSHTTNPGATSWFKRSALHLLERVEGYLELLHLHGVDYEVVRLARPGRIIYEDDDQIVVVPWEAVNCPACQPTQQLEPIQHR
jgi:hypothetical protein